MKKYINYLIFSFILTSCNANLNQITTVENKNNFNYETTKKINVNLKMIPNTKNSIYYLDNQDNPNLIGNYISDYNGIISQKITIPSYVEKIKVQNDFLGNISELFFKIKDNSLVPYHENNINNIFNLKSTTYNFMGDFSLDLGVPKYLEKENDKLDKSFLEDVNASLPEKKAVPNFNPEYLDKNIDKNIILNEDAEIWITFVHEGAGWLNSIGFYTYDAANPPKNINDIKEKTIIFPNFSYIGSGGGLISGNKVYLGKFKKGQAIGWFMVAQGWKKGSVSGIYELYSNEDLNPESNVNLKQHSVLLNDKTREKFLVGMEDIRRDWSGYDNDFNDAIFYFTVSPYSAVKKDLLPPVKTSNDSDGDGITDTFDEFPSDPTKTTISYSPAKSKFATLTFEDNWPKKGDNDHNDLVIDYNFEYINNKENKTLEINANFSLQAIGAAYRNGFGIEFPFSKSLVEKVEGYKLSNNSYIKLDSNGTEVSENSNDKAVIFIFDDAYTLYPDSKDFVNTKKDLPYLNPVNLKINIKLKEPTKIEDSAPYNPFLIVNKDRGREIHLPDYTPTNKVNSKFFKTEDDDSVIENGRYYKTSKNIPWVMHFPEKWRYPKEYIPINYAYYYFNKWAESSGQQYKDWYKDIPGYYDPKKLYK